MQQAQEYWDQLKGQLYPGNTTPGFDAKAISSRVQLIKDCLHQLNQLLTTQQFDGPEDEIRYFKHIQPNVFGHLIYYLRIARIESSIPPGVNATKADIYRKEIRRVYTYFDRHKERYRYYRFDYSYLDDRFFIRTAGNQQYILESCPLLDWRLTTPVSQLFARFKAYEMLLEYLHFPDSGGSQTNPALTWSAQKVQLAELLYALDSIKAFGSVATTFLAEAISTHWNVQLSFIHKTFEEIRLRKKNRTPFLDLLKNSLVQRMEQEDDR